jgi:hypothetical protein
MFDCLVLPIMHSVIIAGMGAVHMYEALSGGDLKRSSEDRSPALSTSIGAAQTSSESVM